MNKLNQSELKEFLDQKFNQYNEPGFIESDPIQIPHRFSKKEDIEIAGFLASEIAWGKRIMIIRNANNMMEALDNSPYEFLMNVKVSELEKFTNVGHRTFKGEDFIYFLKALRNIYINHGGLESVFTKGYKSDASIISAIKYFREVFFELEHPLRTKKHIADAGKNSAAKRINMFLMWMVRNDGRGVHFGLWNDIPTSKLLMPLDVHSGNTSRSLGLLDRTQNDLKAVCELTDNLRKLDPNDPVKYDFALFGLGVFESFSKISKDLEE